LIRHHEHSRARFLLVSRHLLATVRSERHAVDDLLVALPVDRIS
jgi:hypothetical protein